MPGLLSFTALASKGLCGSILLCRHFFLLLLSAAAIGAAERTVWMELHCLSPMVHAGTSRVLGQTYVLEFSSGGGPNGEMPLAPIEVPFSHGGTFLITDPVTLQKIPFFYGLDIPDLVDTNSNGLHDFFEVELTANGRTFGIYSSYDEPEREHPMYATWSRSPGSPSGTVTIELPRMELIFRHTFFILQYQGNYQFSRSPNGLDGQVSLVRADNSNKTLNGPMRLTVRTDNVLELVSASFQTLEQVSVSFAPLEPLEPIGMNYLGVVATGDGLPDSPDGDFNYWAILLKTSDANNDGRLDLIEPDPLVVQQPRLTVVKKGDSIELSIRGKLGERFMLQRKANLSDVFWSDVQFVTLESVIQVVTLPVGEGNAFFRLRQ